MKALKPNNKSGSGILHQVQIMEGVLAEFSALLQSKGIQACATRDPNRTSFMTICLKKYNMSNLVIQTRVSVVFSLCAHLNQGFYCTIFLPLVLYVGIDGWVLIFTLQLQQDFCG